MEGHAAAMGREIELGTYVDVASEGAIPGGWRRRIGSSIIEVEKKIESCNKLRPDQLLDLNDSSCRESRVRST